MLKTACARHVGSCSDVDDHLAGTAALEVVRAELERMRELVDRLSARPEGPDDK